MGDAVAEIIAELWITVTKPKIRSDDADATEDRKPASIEVQLPVILYKRYRAQLLTNKKLSFM